MNLKIALFLGVMGASSINAMSFEKFHKMARDPKTTTRELVEAYDRILIESSKRLAEIVLEKLKHTTIDTLRKELSGEPEKVETAQEEEWPL